MIVTYNTNSEENGVYTWYMGTLYYFHNVVAHLKLF